MPTEELFGAYHFDEDVANDSFDFRVDEDRETEGLLLPAVQTVREGARSSTKDDDHKDWIDILTMSPPVNPASDDVVQNAGLRSDGELVQAVSEMEMSGDFIF